MEFKQKEMIIASIRRVSLVISILCLAVAFFNGIALWECITGTIGFTSAQFPESEKLLLTVGYGFTVAIMLLSAVLFFTMSRNGRPFTPKKIRLVLLIGVLLFIHSLVPTIIRFPLLGIRSVLTLVTSSSLLESLMFLLAALIMYYASILQRESDETL